VKWRLDKQFSGGNERGVVVYSNIEKVATNDAMPLKAARRDAVAMLKSFWGFAAEPQKSPVSFHLRSLCGATLMSLPQAECRIYGG